MRPCLIFYSRKSSLYFTLVGSTRQTRLLILISNKGELTQKKGLLFVPCFNTSIQRFYYILHWWLMLLIHAKCSGPLAIICLKDNVFNIRHYFYSIYCLSSQRLQLIGKLGLKKIKFCNIMPCIYVNVKLSSLLSIMSFNKNKVF